jgi:hypothetical protein
MSGAWGTVTTLRAPPDLVTAFVRHHLSIGAAQIWLYFDDPDDPAAEIADALPRTVVIRSDAAHWARIGRRPDRHQNRQVRNAQMAYRTAEGLDWIAHVDVDEWIWPDRPMADILSDVPDADAPTGAMLRLLPFEAMHDPSLPPGPVAARHFRPDLRRLPSPLRSDILGIYAAMLPTGLLSHHVGKAVFRRGVSDLMPRIHTAFLGGERLAQGPVASDCRLLHFHANNREAWRRALPFRLSRGAYQYAPMLAEFLRRAIDAGTGDGPAAAEKRDAASVEIPWTPDLRHFYDETQCLTEPKRTLLRAADALFERPGLPAAHA